MNVRLKAPAKINLNLFCLGRRPDGYHQVDTTIAAISLYDEVAVTAKPGTGQVHLEVAGAKDVPTDGKNLAFQAASAVLARSGGRQDVDIHLEKQIPTAAGLGGGSSDAAAAALGTALATGLGLGAARGILKVLATLGSDCPFFLAARDTGLARCRGRGEEVTPLPALGQRGVLLVTPDVQAETQKVYHGWRPTDATAVDSPEDWNALSIDAARAALKNDLEGAALRSIAGLTAWRRLLDDSGLRHARLAGSGSSFFALFASVRDAQNAEALLKGKAARNGLRPRLIRALRTVPRSIEVLQEKRSG